MTPPFSASIVAISSTLGAVFPNSILRSFSGQLAQGMPLYNLLYIAGIIFILLGAVLVFFMFPKKDEELKEAQERTLKALDGSAA